MAQPVQVELIGKDRASAAIQGVANTLERMKISVESNRAGLGKLDNALKDSAMNALQTQGSMGRLADALLEFAPGGLIGAGVVAGIGAIISIKKKMQETDKELYELQAKSALDAARITGTVDKEMYEQAIKRRDLAIKELEDKNKGFFIRTGMDIINYFKTPFDNLTNTLLTIATILPLLASGFGLLNPGIALAYAGFSAIIMIGKKLTEQIPSLLKFLGITKEITFDKILDEAKAQDFARALADINKEFALIQDAYRFAPVRERVFQLDLLKGLIEFGLADNTQKRIAINLERELLSIARDRTQDLRVRLEAAKALGLDERIRQAREAEKQRKKQIDEEQAALLKRLYDEGEAEINAREESLKIQTENLRKAVEEQDRIREASVKYNDYLANQILSSNKKLTNDEIEFVRKRIQENQAMLAFFALKGNTEGMMAARQKIKEDEDKLVAQMLSTPMFTAVEVGVNALADAFSAMGAALATGQNALVAFGKAAKQAIGQSLQILGREQLVKGLSNLASGFAAAALGPIGGKSSKDFFKAAGFNFSAAALAGAAGGALGGGAAGGGGVAGGGFSNSQLGRNNFITQQPLTIIVQGGSLLDMSNPDTVRSFTSALETVSSRRITINRVGA